MTEPTIEEIAAAGRKYLAARIAYSEQQAQADKLSKAMNAAEAELAALLGASPKIYSWEEAPPLNPNERMADE